MIMARLTECDKQCRARHAVPERPGDVAGALGGRTCTCTLKKACEPKRRECPRKRHASKFLPFVLGCDPFCGRIFCQRASCAKESVVSVPPRVE